LSLVGHMLQHFHAGHMVKAFRLLLRASASALIF
jgi:hypothetical protein